MPTGRSHWPASTPTPTTATIHSGPVLLHHGIDLDLPDGDYASTLIHLQRTQP
jgi:hypothetical protein